jgi:endonuclease/exonuclease/phosphatase family metal-dependent hydrolase
MLHIALLAVFAAQPALGASSSVVRVVTLNAWGLPEPIAHDRSERFPLINDWLTAAGADVIGLQEVWRGADRLLRLAGVVHPPNRRDSGLMLASRWPISGLTLTRYRQERGFDAWKSKGLLEAVVDTPAGPLRAFVTHLQAGAGPKNASVRRSQVEELAVRVEASPEPVLLMGDLNFYSREPTDLASRSRLADAGLSDAAATMGAEQATFDRLGQRFDHVLYKGNAGHRVVARDARVVPYDLDPNTDAPPPLSDHHPLAVSLEVSR